MSNLQKAYHCLQYTTDPLVMLQACSIAFESLLKPGLSLVLIAFIRIRIQVPISGLIERSTNHSFTVWIELR
tara:strand:+ start:146 stop:361 length:216 start_codon:yes stop_codon:yes gene_type:complete